MTMRYTFCALAPQASCVWVTLMALINYLHAKRSDGTFILRMDDTDDTRSTVEFADGIRKDITWLGMAWDEEFRQSDRLVSYETARGQADRGWTSLSLLRDTGRVGSEAQAFAEFRQATNL